MKKTNIILRAFALVLFLALSMHTVAPAVLALTEGDFQIENGKLVKYTGSDAVVRIPDSVTEIEHSAFNKNETVQEVYLGKNVVNISYNAFCDCPALTTVWASETDAEIDMSGAFGGTTKVTEVKFSADAVRAPEGLLDIETVERFTVDAGNPYFFSVDGVLFERADASRCSLLRMPISSPITVYRMPSDIGLTKIKERSFENCRNLTEIYVADGVLEIEQYAFNSCKALTYFDMGADVRQAGYQILHGCESMNTVKISPSLREDLTDSYVLSWSYAKKLIIPEGAEYIPERAFTTSTLTDIKVEAGHPRYYDIDGVLYEKDENGRVTLVICPRSKTDTSYVIPEGVHEIGEDAFYDNKHITSVSLPDSLEVIGDSAFYYCTALAEVKMGKNVQKIEYGAFYECDSLTSLTLPEKLDQSMDNTWFNAHCDNLTTIIVPKDAQYVPVNAVNVESITQIKVEEGNAKYFDDDGILYMLDDDGRIVLHTFPESKTDASYTVLDGTKEIREDAFYGIKTLVSVSLPDSLEVIGDSAFYYCTALAEVKMGKNVQKIEYGAFYECDSLTSLTLPEKLDESMDNTWFNAYCDNLTTIIVPKDAQYVPVNAVNVESITQIKVEEGNAKYFDDGGVLYEKTDKGYILHTYPEQKTDTSYTVLDGTVEIRKDAFEDNVYLTSVTLPESLLIIGQYAFSNCKALAQVDMGKNVTYIAYGAFGRCESLTSFTLPEKLDPNKNDNAVYDCPKLTTLIIPASAQFVPADFAEEKSLTEIVVVDEAGNRDVTGTAYTTRDGILYNADMTELISIPRGKQITDYILSESVTKIADHAADGQRYLTSLTLHAGVTDTGNYSFRNCPNLSAVYAKGCNPEKVGWDSLEGNAETVIVCDSGSSIETFAIKNSLVYMTGENMITLDLMRRLSDGSERADALSEYHIEVYLGEGVDENRSFPAYSAGNYILLPAGRTTDGGQSINDYSKVTIRLVSRDKACDDLVLNVTLDGKKCATVSARALEKGSIRGNVSAVESYSLALYDGEGKLVKTLTPSDGAFSAEKLTAGEYTVVLIQGSVRNWIQQTLEAYTALGMTEGEDYAKKTVTVSSNTIAECDISLTNKSSYVSDWMDATATSFLLNSTDFETTGLMNFNLSYAFADKYKDMDISGIKVYFTLSNGLEVYIESVEVNDEPAKNEHLDHQTGDINTSLRVDTETDKSANITFSASPTVYGTIVASAVIEFYAAGAWCEVYLGGISEEMEYLTIDVPSRTDSKQVLIEGVTVPGATVTIIDNGYTVATVTAYSSGRWAKLITLQSDEPLHYIRAEVNIDGDKYVTPEYELMYDDNLVAVTDALMFYNGITAVAEMPIGAFQPTHITWTEHGYQFSITVKNYEVVDKLYIKYQDCTEWGYNCGNGVYTFSTTFDLDSTDPPPTVIEVGYTAKSVSEAFSSEVASKNSDPAELADQADELPDIWKNATGVILKDTRDTDGYGELVFTVTLADENKTVLNYHTKSVKQAAKTRAELDADPSFIKTIGDDGSTVYIKISYEEQYSSGGGMMLIPEIGFSYKTARSSGNGTTNVTMGAEIYRFGSGNELGEGFMGEMQGAAIGAVSGLAGTANSYFGFGKTVIEIGGGFVDLAKMRAEIPSDQTDRIAAMDNLIAGYMVLGALQYGAAVVALGAALAGAPFMVGLAIAGITALMNCMINQFLNGELLKIMDLKAGWIIDPSGYAYEAVYSNRVEGVTATVYYRDPSTGETVKWNAEEYSQINPQITGKDGVFAWVTPAGEWKVVLEKDGYVTAESEWLPVPPVQDKVYLSMVSTELPKVVSLHLYADSAVIEFSQYMKVDSMSSDIFGFGNASAGEITALDLLPSAADENVMLAKTFRIKYSGSTDSVTVSANAENYAGNKMAADYKTSGLKVEHEITELSGADSASLTIGEEYKYELKIAPAAGADAAKLKIDIFPAYGAELVSITEPNAEGIRVITLKAVVACPVTVTLTVEGSSAEKILELDISLTRSSQTDPPVDPGTDTTDTTQPPETSGPDTTTDAPDLTNEITTPQSDPESSSEPSPEKGCGSFAACSVIIVLMLAVGFTVKKKEE